MKNDAKIKTPSDLRNVLFETMVALLDGRVDIPRANAVVGLSAEAHKSIRQEWDMRCYASDHLAIEDGQIIDGRVLISGVYSTTEDEVADVE